jgi:hypothetical protein
MLITRTSPFTGMIRTKDIPVSKEAYALWKTGGMLIQRAMPNLTPDQREFIKTGITAEEWDNTFGGAA